MKITDTKCGYSWNTKSKMLLISCPNCGNKVKKCKGETTKK